MLHPYSPMQLAFYGHMLLTRLFWVTPQTISSFFHKLKLVFNFGLFRFNKVQFRSSLELRFLYSRYNLVFIQVHSRQKGPILVHFRSTFGPNQVDLGAIKVILRTIIGPFRYILSPFLVNFRSIFWYKLYPILVQFGSSLFGSILGPVWIQFGSILGLAQVHYVFILVYFWSK